MKIEKLTEDEREAVRRGTCQASGPKALRIIDQLTAALEAKPESRAEALQARVAELEREVESSDAGRDSAFDLIEQKSNELDAAHGALETAESELADLRGRVERAKAAMWQAFGRYTPDWPGGARDALEALSDR